MPASQTSAPSPTASGTRSRPQPLLTPSGLPAITDWSLDPAVRYLNHGSFGIVPVTAQRAQAVYRATMDANPCGWFPMLHERVAAVRADIAAHLGAAPA